MESEPVRTETPADVENENEEATENLGEGVQKFSLTSKKTGVKGDFTYRFGDDLDDMVDLFGADVVEATARQQFVIKAQGVCRRILDNAGTVADAQAKLDKWVPGKPAARKAKDPLSQIMKDYRNMTVEQQAEVKEQLEAMMSEGQ